MPQDIADDNSISLDISVNNLSIYGLATIFAIIGGLGILSIMTLIIMGGITDGDEQKDLEEASMLPSSETEVKELILDLENS